jgi:DNA-binding transcriptional ArsR family regulator
MMKSLQSIFAIQAELCRAMGNARRQEIVHLLRQGPMRVGAIAHEMDCAQPTISRHLIALRNAGVVSSQRRADGIYYQIANPKIMSVCDLMREVLIEQTHERSKLMKSLDQ